ncbi:MAG: hypothetical protein AAFO07_28980 [Bacteroidota bacterium]
MKIPVDLFMSSISPRKVYYFSSEKLNTNVPHYFICVAKADNELLILVCCTSQFEKRSRFIEINNFPTSTLVWINPDDENGLELDSYVDCNGYFDYTLEEFRKLYQEDLLEYKGEISENHFEQIKIGLIESPTVEAFIKEIIE